MPVTLCNRCFSLPEEELPMQPLCPCMQCGSMDGRRLFESDPRELFYEVTNFDSVFGNGL